MWTVKVVGTLNLFGRGLCNDLAGVVSQVHSGYCVVSVFSIVLLVHMCLICMLC